MHPEIRITTDRGIATLWLAFPGEPVNALDLSRLMQLDAAVGSLAGNRFLDQIVVRSAKPEGFCAGLHPDAVRSLTHPSDRAAFSRYGQTVFARLASLPQPIIAFLEGPCLGAGFELALACDYRLCVAGLANHLGFPFEPPCFGGSSRVPKSLLDSRRTLSGREARSLGLVDRAFCERRARIELQTFLNEAHPKPRRASSFGLAEETRAFAVDMGRAWQPLPALEPEIALARGFITPLEFEQLPKPASPVREPASGLRSAA
jgi:enoyl-CoA hydratase/carnithine racemase